MVSSTGEKTVRLSHSHRLHLSSKRHSVSGRRVLGFARQRFKMQQYYVPALPILKSANKKSLFPSLTSHGKQERDQEFSKKRYRDGGFMHNPSRMEGITTPWKSTSYDSSSPYTPFSGNSTTTSHAIFPSASSTPIPTPTPPISTLPLSRARASVAREHDISLTGFLNKLLNVGYEVSPHIQHYVQSTQPTQPATPVNPASSLPTTVNLAAHNPLETIPSYRDSFLYSSYYTSLTAPQQPTATVTSDEELRDQLSKAAVASKQDLDMYSEKIQTHFRDSSEVSGCDVARLLGYHKTPLTATEMKETRDILVRNVKGYGNDDILIDKFNIDFNYAKFICLRPRTWLNDEAINFYMLMLQERDDLLCKHYSQSPNPRRSSHFFNSFFLPKLLENDTYTYSQVRRWTKKFDLFSKDKVFFPVNISNTHWTLCVVYVQKKEIRYYDSMAGQGTTYMKHIRRYLIDEAMDKKKMTMTEQEWKMISVGSKCPQQQNGFDCGVFTVTAADFLSDDLPLEYDQSEMDERRYRIANYILKGSLPYPIP